MKNPLTMMKQVQELQSKMAELQAELETLEVEGTSGGGLVKVTLTGKGLMARISIDASLIKPEEAESWKISSSPLTMTRSKRPK